jgi:hypothetical protein
MAARVGARLAARAGDRRRERRGADAMPTSLARLRAKLGLNRSAWVRYARRRLSGVIFGSSSDAAGDSNAGGDAVWEGLRRIMFRRLRWRRSQGL